MKKTRFKILLVITIIVFTFVTSQVIIFATKAFFTEPIENAGKVPKNLIWNEERGEYYDPVEFEWDSQNNTYNAKFIEREASMESVMSQGEEQRLWVEKHKTSNDLLDIAIVKYFKHNSNPNESSGFSSKYEPEKDEGLKYLTDLGDKETDKMIDRIEKNDAWAGILMCAVEKIKKIDIPSDYKNASPEGIKKWVAYVKEKIK